MPNFPGFLAPSACTPSRLGADGGLARGLDECERSSGSRDSGRDIGGGERAGAGGGCADESCLPVDACAPGLPVDVGAAEAGLAEARPRATGRGLTDRDAGDAFAARGDASTPYGAVQSQHDE